MSPHRFAFQKGNIIVFINMRLAIEIMITTPFFISVSSTTNKFGTSSKQTPFIEFFLCKMTPIQRFDSLMLVS